MSRCLSFVALMALLFSMAGLQRGMIVGHANKQNFSVPAVCETSPALVIDSIEIDYDAALVDVDTVLLIDPPGAIISVPTANRRSVTTVVHTKPTSPAMTWLFCHDRGNDDTSSEPAYSLLDADDEFEPGPCCVCRHTSTRFTSSKPRDRTVPIPESPAAGATIGDDLQPSLVDSPVRRAIVLKLADACEAGAQVLHHVARGLTDLAGERYASRGVNPQR